MMRLAAACVLLAVAAAGCAAPHVATTRLDADGVEIILDTSKRHVPDDQMKAVFDEAELRCSQHDRDAKHVSDRFQYQTLQNGLPQGYRHTFLFQCVLR